MAKLKLCGTFSLRDHLQIELEDVVEKSLSEPVHDIIIGEIYDIHKSLNTSLWRHTHVTLYER